jgi:hypothetical protein
LRNLLRNCGAAHEHLTRLILPERDERPAHPIGAWITGERLERKRKPRARCEPEIHQSPAAEALALGIDGHHFGILTGTEIR